MSKRYYNLFLKDIRDYSKKILEYTEKKTFGDFTGNQMLIDAVIRNLEVIGEAVKNLPDNERAKYNNINWKKVAGLRDILIHEYFGIDYEILWDIIQNKIPDLHNKIEEILKK